MRIHAIQDNLQKSDLISRLQQTMQDPARIGTEEAARGSLERTRLVQEQAQEVPEQENKIIEDGGREEPFAQQRRRREENPSEEAEEPPPDDLGGSIDVTA